MNFIIHVVLPFIMLLEGNTCHARAVILYSEMFLLVENTHTHSHTHAHTIIVIIVIAVVIIIIIIISVFVLSQSTRYSGPVLFWGPLSFGSSPRI